MCNDVGAGKDAGKRLEKRCLPDQRKRVFVTGPAYAKVYEWLHRIDFFEHRPDAQLLRNDAAILPESAAKQECVSARRDMTSSATIDHRLATIRIVLFCALMFGFIGLLAELALLAHYEDLNQRIPLVLLGAGAVALPVDLLVSRRWTRGLIQLIMGLFIVSGLVGVYFHFAGSREFQLEMDPQMSGTTLIWQVLRAKSPPTLSPGTMVQMGILGLGYVYLRRIP
jgi:hypothetical protein